MDGSRSSSRENGDFDFYKRNAELLAKQGEHTRAIDMYTRALELHVMDRTCLLQRSKCHVMVGNFNEALRDADDSLGSDAAYYKGVYQKAEVLYMLGEFEASLVLYQRAHQLKQTEESRQGVQRATHALNTTIPQMPVRSKYSINRTDNINSRGVIDGADEQSDDFSRHHLGSLYQDKLFLEKLLKEIDPTNKITTQIHDIAKRGLNYLDTRSRFWHQREPMHIRRRLRAFSARAESMHAKPTSPTERDNSDGSQSNQTDVTETTKTHTHYIVDILKRIDHEQSTGHYDKSLKLAKECLKMVENLNEVDLPNKYEMLSTLHSCMGNAQLELNKYEAALRHHKIDLQLAQKGYTTAIMCCPGNHTASAPTQHGETSEIEESQTHDCQCDYSIEEARSYLDNIGSIEEARSRALDNIGRVYARMGRFQDAIDTWETKIKLTDSPIEKMWLAHEIGRCFFELKKYAEAHAYGKISLALAHECREALWEINATVLIAQTEVHLGRFDTAIDLFEKAAKLSEIQGDEEAVATLTTAITELRSKIQS